jgi:hypothetical protein
MAYTTVPTNNTDRRFPIGWKPGSPPAAIYLTFMAWNLSLLPMLLVRSVGFISLSAALAVAVVIVVAKSRAFVEIRETAVVVAPAGSVGSKATFPISSLTSVSAPCDAKLIFMDVSHTSHDFGPWVTLWGRSTGMRARCDLVAHHINQRLKGEISPRPVRPDSDRG